MSSTVIRDFLVGLTFKTDDTGAKKTKDALDSNEKSQLAVLDGQLGKSTNGLSLNWRVDKRRELRLPYFL